MNKIMIQIFFYDNTIYKLAKNQLYSTQYNKQIILDNINTKFLKLLCPKIIYGTDDDVLAIPSEQPVIYVNLQFQDVKKLIDKNKLKYYVTNVLNKDFIKLLLYCMCNKIPVKKTYLCQQSIDLKKNFISYINNFTFKNIRQISTTTTIPILTFIPVPKQEILNKLLFNNLMSILKTDVDTLWSTNLYWMELYQYIKAWKKKKKLLKNANQWTLVNYLDILQQNKQKTSIQHFEINSFIVLGTRIHEFFFFNNNNNNNNNRIDMLR
nr:hypothetical protein [Microctonus hyperodae filamentous virus]